ncbi:MAG: VOC family protein [Patescibacteria group bacterium]
MNRTVHFEIHAEDLDRAQKFYSEVFGWEFTDMGESMSGYRLIVTGKADSTGPDGKPWPGINGGMLKRKGPAPTEGQAVNAFVCTMDVENIDETIKKGVSMGGTMATLKMEVPGVGWLAYMKDTEGNIFGIMQAFPVTQ